MAKKAQLIKASGLIIKACVVRQKAHGATESVLASHWFAVEILKRTGEKAYLKAALRLFAAQKKDTLQRLGRALPKADFELATRIFDLNRWYDETSKLFGPLTAQSVVQGFRAGAQRIGVDIPFPEGDLRAVSLMKEVLAKTKGINDTVLEQLAEALQAGQELGEGKEELAQRVAQVFGVAANRAATIAQTASTPLFERGQLTAFQDAGISSRTWLSRRDGLVREGIYDHVEPDGQEVGLTEPFSISGESLMFPGDPVGSAGNVINCRCTQQPKI